MDKSATTAILCLVVCQLNRASEVEFSLFNFAQEPSFDGRLLSFQPIRTSFEILYQNTAALDFYAKNKIIYTDKQIICYLFLVLKKTQKDGIKLVKAYRKFYENSNQPADYKCLLDTFQHTHKILQLMNRAIDKLLKIDDSEEYEKSLQDSYAKTHAYWQEPLETLTYIIYDHVATLTERYHLDTDDLVLCARLQQVLARSPEQFSGYALDYD